MISVVVLINGQPIVTRSAHRLHNIVDDNDEAFYKVDDTTLNGKIINHKPVDGAVELAKKLLSTIEE